MKHALRFFREILIIAGLIAGTVSTIMLHAKLVTETGVNAVSALIWALTSFALIIGMVAVLYTRYIISHKKTHDEPDDGERKLLAA